MIDTGRLVQLRGLLDQLEELSIEAGLSGPTAVADPMAGLFERVAQLLLAGESQPGPSEFPSPLPSPGGGGLGGGQSAIETCRAAVTLLRGLLQGTTDAPRGLVELLLQVLTALSQLLSGTGEQAVFDELREQLQPPKKTTEIRRVAPDIEEVFAQEANGCLERLEHQVMSLEKTTFPAPAEALRQLARDLHNLKGSASMAGHEDIVAVAHELETRVLSVSSAEDLAATVDALFAGHDRVAEILAGLARKAALAPGIASSPESSMYLQVTAAACRLLVPLSDVVRVEKLPRCTRIPFTPGYVLGLANLGGELMPLLALASRLSLAAGAGILEWALVVGAPDDRLALAVDTVGEVLSIRHSQLSPKPDAPDEMPDAALLEGQGQLPVLRVQQILNCPLDLGEPAGAGPLNLRVTREGQDPRPGAGFE